MSIKYITIDNWNSLYDENLFNVSKDIIENYIFKINNKNSIIFTPEIQKLIYDALDKSDVILITGGTGIGKTRYLPHLLFNYFKNIKNYRKIKIIITEPRRSTVEEPFKRIQKDIGQDKEFFTKDSLPLFKIKEFKKIDKNKIDDFLIENIKKIRNAKKIRNKETHTNTQNGLISFHFVLFI
jgi:predicted ATP-dependent serine protease